MERFWEKVNKTDTCWLWVAALRNSGRHSQAKYGQFKYRGRNEAAHRVSWMLEHGQDIPEGICVLHTCDNTICVNPKHLFLGTHKSNMRDKIAKKRDHNQQKTHCHRGHPLYGDNLYVRTDGNRTCKTCRRASQAKHYYRNHEEMKEKKRNAMRVKGGKYGKSRRNKA